LSIFRNVIEGFVPKCLPVNGHWLRPTVAQVASKHVQWWCLHIAAHAVLSFTGEAAHENAKAFYR
jgi:hypothetical protein